MIKSEKVLIPIIGTESYIALKSGDAVLKIWRRSSPHNWWIETNDGDVMWHSSEDRTDTDNRLQYGKHLDFFELLENSKGHTFARYKPHPIRYDSSTYKLK